MRLRHIKAGLVLGLLLTAAVAGCGGADDGDGVATAGGDSTATSSATPDEGTDQEQALQYADCMRENGVPNYPDPDAQGHFNINADELGLEPNDPTFAAAEEACEQYLPGGGEPEPEIDADTLEQMREYSQCMRENGVPNFPDPSDEGGLSLNGDELGMDPNDPAYQAAEEACNDLMPGTGGATHSQAPGGDA